MIHARKDYERFVDVDELKPILEALAFARSANKCNETWNKNGEEIVDSAIKSLQDRIALLPKNKKPLGKEEPVMLFRAQDKHFIPLLQAYANMLRNDPKVKSDIVTEVEGHIRLALEWEKTHSTKTPDLVN